MTRLLATTALIGAFFLAPALAQTMAPANSPPAAAQKGRIGAADRSFAHDAAVSGMAEIELGKLAEQKGAATSIKDFGREMVSDHTKADDRLAAAATARRHRPSDRDRCRAQDRLRLDRQADRRRFRPVVYPQCGRRSPEAGAAFRARKPVGREPRAEAVRRNHIAGDPASLADGASDRGGDEPQRAAGRQSAGAGGIERREHAAPCRQTRRHERRSAEPRGAEPDREPLTFLQAERRASLFSTSFANRLAPSGRISSLKS